MKIFLKAVAALFLLMLAIWAIRSDSGHDGYVSAAPLAEGGDPAWRRSPVWDDGKAEVCAYQVTWAYYGRRYDGRALLVLVKEPWAPDLDVKADSPRPDGFDVLYRLLRFEREDGTAYRLAKCERIPYWQMSRPGDEAWLPASVR